MKNYNNQGHTVTVTAAATYSPGDGIKIGTGMAGVAQHSAVSGDALEVALEGVYQIAKDSTVAIVQGDKLYFHTTNKATTASSSGNPLGFAMEAAATGVTTVAVKLGAF